MEATNVSVSKYQVVCADWIIIKFKLLFIKISTFFFRSQQQVELKQANMK
jgi:hypothetical protein